MKGEEGQDQAMDYQQRYHEEQKQPAERLEHFRGRYGSP